MDGHKVEEELEECVQYVENIRAKVADAQSAEENSKDDLDNLKAELDEKTEQIQAFRVKEVGYSELHGTSVILTAIYFTDGAPTEVSRHQEGGV